MHNHLKHKHPPTHNNRNHQPALQVDHQLDLILHKVLLLALQDLSHSDQEQGSQIQDSK